MTMTRRGFFRWLRDCFRDDALSRGMPKGDLKIVVPGKDGTPFFVGMDAVVHLDNGQRLAARALLEMRDDGWMVSVEPVLFREPLIIDPRQP